MSLSDSLSFAFFWRYPLHIWRFGSSTSGLQCRPDLEDDGDRDLDHRNLAFWNEYGMEIHDDNDNDDYDELWIVTLTRKAHWICV